MKLRIRGDSIRLRLTRSEVEAIARGERVQEQMHMVASTLRYTLLAGNVAQPEAAFSEGDLSVTLPAELAQRWSTSEEVGIDANQETGEGRSLRILVEKDFKCLTARPDEDDSDAFANPAGSHASHGDAP